MDTPDGAAVRTVTVPWRPPERLRPEAAAAIPAAVAAAAAALVPADLGAIAFELHRLALYVKPGREFGSDPAAAAARAEAMIVAWSTDLVAEGFCLAAVAAGCRDYRDEPRHVWWPGWGELVDLVRARQRGLERRLRRLKALMGVPVDDGRPDRMEVTRRLSDLKVKRRLLGALPAESAAGLAQEVADGEAWFARHGIAVPAGEAVASPPPCPPPSRGREKEGAPSAAGEVT